MLKNKLKITIACCMMALATMAHADDIWRVNYPKHEERAVWLATIGGIDWPRTKAVDERSTERQKQELTDILDLLQRANINVVLLQTRIRGSVIYPSDIENWDEAITGRAGRAPSYDPLQFAIEECHRRGMELHAWLVTIPLGTSSRQKAYGQMSVTKRHPELCKTIGGEVFMIPGKPATADYVASIAREIVTRYDVDGISLDYIRYPESQYHFNDDNLYTTSTGMTLADWRRDNITRIVRRVHDEVKAIKPWVKLSSSPIGKYRNLSRYRSGGWDCYDAVYQDPQAWLRDNLQDMLFPMMYFLGDNYYPFLYDWAENNYGHPIAAGLGIYFLDPREGRWQLNDVRAEMHAARNSGVGGIAFYRSDFLTRNLKGLYDATCEEFFPYVALTTPMTWMQESCEPKQPTNMSHRDGCITWQYSEPLEHDGWPFISFNIYGSNTYPVDTEAAENLLQHHVHETKYTISGRGTTKRYFAVRAIDRYGNESTALQETITNISSHTYDEIMEAVSRHYQTPATGTETPTTKTSKQPKQEKSKTTKPAKTQKATKPAKPAKQQKAQKPAKQEQQIITIDFSKYLD